MVVVRPLHDGRELARRAARAMLARGSGGPDGFPTSLERTVSASQDGLDLELFR